MSIPKYMIQSVEDIPGVSARAAFSIDSSKVFREDGELSPIRVNDQISYIPWGGDDLMPYSVLELIESDETLSTCLMWNAQMCYGNGLTYNTDEATSKVRKEVEDWEVDNQLPAIFMGMAQDLKFWGFAVTVFILSKDRTKIVRMLRKEAMYCRFQQVDSHGKMRHVLYANWRNCPSASEVEIIPLLDEQAPMSDLMSRKTGTKFAVLTRVPTADHTYYPIPYWASLLRSKWYNIKRLIAVAKESKIKNTAPLKYHVEISDKYFDRIFKREHITDPKEQAKRVASEKKQILDFLTGAENSGKTWFSNFYMTPDGKECHEVVVSRIDSSKEGGDWETDIQEAVNMICFTLQVHSNLVGSVPGKSQTNNSGSDKRELYTIAQALQKPFHDLMFVPHNILIRYNKWHGVTVSVPFIQLSTLDENRDAKMVTLEPNP